MITPPHVWEIDTDGFDTRQETQEGNEANEENPKNTVHIKRERLFLVKWKNLGYHQCTWEWESDVNDDVAVNRFLRSNNPPVDAELDDSEALRCKYPKFYWGSTLNVYTADASETLPHPTRPPKAAESSDSESSGSDSSSSAASDYSYSSDGDSDFGEENKKRDRKAPQATTSNKSHQQADTKKAEKGSKKHMLRTAVVATLKARRLHEREVAEALDMVQNNALHNWLHYGSSISDAHEGRILRWLASEAPSSLREQFTEIWNCPANVKERYSIHRLHLRREIGLRYDGLPLVQLGNHNTSVSRHEHAHKSLPNEEIKHLKVTNGWDPHDFTSRLRTTQLTFNDSTSQISESVAVNSKTMVMVPLSQISSLILSACSKKQDLKLNPWQQHVVQMSNQAPPHPDQYYSFWARSEYSCRRAIRKAFGLPASDRLRDGELDDKEYLQDLLRMQRDRDSQKLRMRAHILRIRYPNKAEEEIQSMIRDGSSVDLSENVKLDSEESDGWSSVSEEEQELLLSSKKKPGMDRPYRPWYLSKSKLSDRVHEDVVTDSESDSDDVLNPGCYPLKIRLRKQGVPGNHYKIATELPNIDQTDTEEYPLRLKLSQKRARDRGGARLLRFMVMTPPPESANVHASESGHASEKLSASDSPANDKPATKQESLILSSRMRTAFKYKLSYLDNEGKFLSDLPVPHLRTRLTVLRHLIYVGGRWILRFLDQSNFASSFPPTMDEQSKPRTTLMDTEAAAIFMAYQFFSTKVAEIMRDRWSPLDPDVVESMAKNDTPFFDTDVIRWQKSTSYHLGPTPSREKFMLDADTGMEKEPEDDNQVHSFSTESNAMVSSMQTASFGENYTNTRTTAVTTSTFQHDPNTKRAPNTGVRLNFIDTDNAPIFVPPKSTAPIPPRVPRGSGFKPLRASLEYPGGKKLRSYQVEGLNWMIQSWHSGRNIILADEMGLGKTAQTVAFLHYLHTMCGVRGPFLIVAPLSTIEHWSREVETWSGGVLNQCFYHVAAGVGRDVRAFVREWEWYYPGYKRNTHKFHVLITTYEVAKADADYLAPIPWEAMIVDEGHKIRGPHSRTKEILQNHLSANFKMLLTGTPLQNNTTELWSLLNFLEPDRWGTAAEFEAEFGELKTHEQVNRLQRVIGPVILRRVKEQVEKSIPKKEETIIDVELTMLQKQYYRAIFEKNRHFLYRGCDKNNLPALSNIEIQLRKCCNHPYLISGVEEKDMTEGEQEMRRAAEADVQNNRSENDGMANGNADNSKTDNASVHAMALSKTQVASTSLVNGPSGDGSAAAAARDDDAEDEDGRISPTAHHRGLKSPLRHSKHHLKGISVHSQPNDPYESALTRQKLNRLVACSGKMVLMDKLLPKLRAEGHKLLIFSQMVRMLDIMEDYCRGRKFPYERIDGGVRGNDRQAAIDRFQNDPNSFIFMLSTRAGGVGINLTAADTVIIFDSDWNPQNDIQATARAHRIGQTQEVKVYRLLTRNTYEAKMFERASKKLALDQAVLGGGDAEERGGKRKPKSVREAEELESLLRHGAYGALSGEGEEMSRKFVESSIDQLLKVNTRTVEVDNTTGYSVFKSSFSLDDKEKKGDDIDINAKDFWERVLPGYVSAAKLLDELNSGNATKDDEARKQFMDKLEKLVTGLKEMREKGELDDNGSFSLGSLGESEVGTTCSLLVQVAAMRSVFSDEDVSKATEWLEQLEGTRVRSCRNQEFGRFEGGVNNDFGTFGRNKPGKRGRKSDKRPRRIQGNETDSSVSDFEESDDEPDEPTDFAREMAKVRKEAKPGESSMYYRAEWGWSVPEADEIMEKKRQAFWRELDKALDENDIPQRSRRCPLLGGKPLDLWTLWKEIVLFGGNDKLTSTGGAWTQLFKKLPNYKKSETSATFRLKNMYKKWLQYVADKYPPQYDESKATKNPDLEEEEDFTVIPKARARQQDAGRYFREFDEQAQEALKLREEKAAKKTAKKRRKKADDDDDESRGTKAKSRKSTAKKRKSEASELGDAETPGGRRRRTKKQLTYNEDQDNGSLDDDDDDTQTTDLNDGASTTGGKRKAKTPKSRKGSAKKKRRRGDAEGDWNDVAPDEVDETWHDSDQEEEITDENGLVIRVQKPLVCALCNNVRIRPGAAKRVDASTHQTSSSSGKGRETDSDTPDTWDEDTGQFLLPFVSRNGNNEDKKKVYHVHQWCAEMSPEVFVNDEGRYCNVISAINRGKQLKCAGCGSAGATIGCQIDSCNKSFHLKCAMDTGWEFGDDSLLVQYWGDDADPRAFYCKKHRAEVGLPCRGPNEPIHSSALKERKEDPPRMKKTELKNAQRTYQNSDELPNVRLRILRWVDPYEFDSIDDKSKGYLALLRWPSNVDDDDIPPTGRDPHSLQNVYEAATILPKLNEPRLA